MLHNLFLLDAESGIPIGTIKLSEEGIEDKEAQLISSSIKAIQDFFSILEFGDLENFQFFKKQIIIHKKNHLVLILVCEKETDFSKYQPKLELIGVMFEKALEWFRYDGVISKYDELVDSAKLFTLTEFEKYAVFSNWVFYYAGSETDSS